MTLNPMQQVMLTVLMGPEDPTAFKKFQGRAYGKKNYRKNPEKPRDYRNKNLEQRRDYVDRNREKINEQRRDYYGENREKINEQRRDYVDRNREKINEQRRDYVGRNREKIRDRRRNYNQSHRTKTREYVNNKYFSDPSFRVAARCRARIWRVIHSAGAKRPNKVNALIGCTALELKEHIEKQFRPGMTWKNIHLDHRKPCASFDLTDPEQQKQCFHYSNLQPLFAEENLRKGAKY